MSSAIIKALGQVDRVMAELTSRELELAVHLVEFLDDSSDQLRTEEVLRAFQTVMATRNRLGSEATLFTKIFHELYGGRDGKKDKDKAKADQPVSPATPVRTGF